MDRILSYSREGVLAIINAAASPTQAEDISDRLLATLPTYKRLKRHSLDHLEPPVAPSCEFSPGKG